VNGKIPDFNNATIDHESLLERLGTYGLAEYQIEGDGNCQVSFLRAWQNYYLKFFKKKKDLLSQFYEENLFRCISIIF